MVGVNMDKKLNILLLEDCVEDADLIDMELRKTGLLFSLKIVVTKSDFLGALKNFVPDLILADYTLPSYDGLSAFLFTHKNYSDVPFIFVSGTIGEEKAIEIMRGGATDYVFKENLSKLGPAVKRALREREEQKKRLIAEKNLKESADQWRTTFDAIDDAICLLNAQGKIIRCNKAMAVFLDKPFGKIIGSFCWELFHNTREPIPGCPVPRMLKTRQRETMLLPCGKNILQVIVDPILDEKGDVFQIVHIISDITERMQVEKSLRESEHKLATHLQNTPIGVLSWDLDFKVIGWNPAAENIFGFSKTEAIGRHATELILPEEMRELVDGIFRDLISEKGGTRSTNENITKNGKRIICDWYNTTLKDSVGNVIGVASLVHDITDRVKTFEALKKQKEFNEKIVQTSSAIIVGLDKNHKIKIFNKGAEKITGFKAEEVIDNDWFEIFFEPDIYDEMNTAWASAWGAKFNSYINPIQAKNGDEKIILWQSTGVYDSADESKHILISIGDDITERIRAEELLKESEEKYRSMMEAMEDAAYICSSDYTIEYMNPAMIKRTGYDATGEPCHKAIHGLDEKCPWCIFEKVNTGESINYEIVSPKDDKNFHISNSRIVHTDGSISKLSVFRDLTEFKKMEKQFRQAQRMEAIGTLAGGIAHDFNNILFPILGYADMLLMEIPEDSQLRDSLNQIHTSALRAKDLVRQILTFSRQDTNELLLVKIQPIVKEALKLIRSTISTTIDITQDIRSDCGAIKADPTQIHQIIINLTTNAYHAMEDTGGELRVGLKEVELGEHDVITPDMVPGVYACLTVSDTGTGMDKDVIEKIFDPFFTTKKTDKGTGMGLSVVHGIVKNIGGSIHVYSEPGKGTEFKAYFPIEKSSFEKQNIQTKEPIQGGTERILLVDDEDVIIAMEKRVLERLGYQVTSRNSSIDALETFRADPDKFDLVITDMAMPNMPGDKLSVELIKIHSDIPILLCTGFSETMSEEKAASLGIKGFLLKPIVMRALAKKIREVLGKNKA
jgi:PAS domain S-box-containing protein